MNWLPVDSVLGELEIVEVFAEYKGPRLFSVRSATDQDYLAEWAAPLDDSDLWLYVPVSKLRLSAIRSGLLTVRTAFTNPESFEYRIRLYRDASTPDEVGTIRAADLEEAWLPAEDFRLELQTPTHPAAGPLEEVARKSKQEGRARFRMEFELQDIFLSEGPTRKVASTLTAVQNLFDNLGLAEQDGNPHTSGPFANSVKDDMGTNVAELLAASFVIELGGAQRDDLLGDSPVARAGNRIVKMLSPSLSSQELVESLEEIKPRAAKSFRTFVHELEAWHTAVTIASAGAANGVQGQKLSYEQVSNLDNLLKNVLPAVTIEIRGRMGLFAGNLKEPRQTFGLRDLYDNAEYSGRVGLQARQQIEHATFGEVYDVILIEYSSRDAAVGETKLTYSLEQLSKAGDETPLAATRTVITSESDFISPFS